MSGNIPPQVATDRYRDHYDRIDWSKPDDLDALIDKRTKANPDFPRLMEEAAKKRKPMSRVVAAIKTYEGKRKQ